MRSAGEICAVGATTGPVPVPLDRLFSLKKAIPCRIREWHVVCRLSNAQPVVAITIELCHAGRSRMYPSVAECPPVRPLFFALVARLPPVVGQPPAGPGEGEPLSQSASRSGGLGRGFHAAHWKRFHTQDTSLVAEPLTRPGPCILPILSGMAQSLLPSQVRTLLSSSELCRAGRSRMLTCRGRIPPHAATTPMTRSGGAQTDR